LFQCQAHSRQRIAAAEQFTPKTHLTNPFCRLQIAYLNQTWLSDKLYPLGWVAVHTQKNPAVGAEASLVGLGKDPGRKSVVR
jgi:hypothetical protein